MANLFLALESGILPTHSFLSLHCLPLVMYVTFRPLMLSKAQPKKNFESECLQISEYGVDLISQIRSNPSDFNIGSCPEPYGT